MANDLLIPDDQRKSEQEAHKQRWNDIADRPNTDPGKQAAFDNLAHESSRSSLDHYSRDAQEKGHDLSTYGGRKDYWNSLNDAQRENVRGNYGGVKEGGSAGDYSNFGDMSKEARNRETAAADRNKGFYKPTANSLNAAEHNSLSSPNSKGLYSKSASPLSGAELNKAEKINDHSPWKTSFGDEGLKNKKPGKPGGNTIVNAERKKSRNERRLIALGLGGSFGTLALLLLLLLSFLAQFRAIHFADVLRSAGLVRFNYLMRKEYTRTIFDADVLSPDSTGSVVDIIKGSKFGLPSAVQDMGRSGSLQFIVDRGGIVKQITGKQVFKGVIVNGDRITLDDISKELGYADFNAAKKAGATKKVSAAFSEKVKFNLADVTNNLSWFNRFRTYSVLRQVANIKLYRWEKLGAKFKNQTNTEAVAENATEGEEIVDNGGTDVGKTGIDIVDNGAKTEKAQVSAGAKVNSIDNGLRRSIAAEKLGYAKDVSDGVLVVTLACIAHAIANGVVTSIPASEKQALRQGQAMPAARDQVLGAETPHQALAAENGSDLNMEHSIMYHADTQQPTTSVEDQKQLPDIPNYEGPLAMFKSVAGAVDDIVTNALLGSPPGSPIQIGDILKALGLGGAVKGITNAECNVLLNQFVQYGIAGAELVITVATAGATKGAFAAIKAAAYGTLKFGFSIGIGELLGKTIDSIIRAVAGVSFSSDMTGIGKYNQAHVAFDAWQEDGNRSILMGAPISAQEAQNQQDAGMAELRQENSQKSFTYRYFAISNPWSLTGRLIAISPSNMGDVANMARGALGSVASVFSSPQHMFGSLLNIVAPNQFGSAAGSDPSLMTVGGVTHWGWTTDEINKIDQDENYSFEANQAYYTAHQQALDNEFNGCYQSGLLQDQVEANMAANPRTCDVAKLHTDEGLRYRGYFMEKNMNDVTPAPAGAH